MDNLIIASYCLQTVALNDAQGKATTPQDVSSFAKSVDGESILSITSETILNVMEDLVIAGFVEQKGKNSGARTMFLRKGS